MPAQHDPLALLSTPVAQALLHSTIPARLAYTGLLFPHGSPIRDGMAPLACCPSGSTGRERSSCWARGWIPAKSKRYQPTQRLP